MNPHLLSVFSSVIFTTFATTAAAKAEASFHRDRAAILGMAGTFEVDFKFAETVSLKEDYEIKKPYNTKALELVKVAEDLGTSITLQHLLVVEDMDGPAVIKHWAQVWIYEDLHSLTFEGRRTWLPVEHSAEQVEGTWTQLVTQVDDSPRYKSFGKWEHTANYSAWTSQLSTRPLPRREYTKRSDYDRLLVTNTHLITPEGWVHLQHNRKEVRREGRSFFLCLETGENTYKRVTPEPESDKAEGIAIAEEYWEATHGFWKEVRALWTELLTTSNNPIHYVAKIDGEKKGLMSRISNLAETAKNGEAVARTDIEAILYEHLR